MSLSPLLDHFTPDLLLEYYYAPLLVYSIVLLVYAIYRFRNDIIRFFRVFPLLIPLFCWFQRFCCFILALTGFTLATTHSTPFL